MQLQYAAHKGLEVVLPQKITEQVNIQALLHSHKQWILQQIAEHPAQPTMPEQINLRAISQCYWVLYEKAALKKCRLQVTESALTLLGPVEQREQTIPLLKEFLLQQARLILLPMLFTLSKTTGLSYSKAIIRGQRACWGSCSSEKIISLNYKLLLLPRHLVKTILLHELCHLRYLNHNKTFWQLLLQFDPQAEHHHQECKSFERELPIWLDAPITELKELI